jgi:ABC-type multidrug transport system ATPase subunit
MIDHQISLTWTSISVEVKQKAILKNISGYCHPGTSLAIMGPSGSGKTTLLATLAKIIDSSLDISGEVDIYRW